jgi:hypothetical protein
MTAALSTPPFYTRLVTPGLIGGTIIMILGPITLVIGLMLPTDFEQFVFLMLAHIFLVIGSMAVGAALLIKQDLNERRKRG